MKILVLFAGSGPIAIMTSHKRVEDPVLIERLRGKGIEKFIAFEIPVELAEERYGNHFRVVANNLHESDDLRVLDYNGQRILQLFRFKELGEPVFHEAPVEFARAA